MPRRPALERETMSVWRRKSFAFKLAARPDGSQAVQNSGILYKHLRSSESAELLQDGEIASLQKYHKA